MERTNAGGRQILALASQIKTQSTSFLSEGTELDVPLHSKTYSIQSHLANFACRFWQIKYADLGTLLARIFHTSPVVQARSLCFK